MLFNWTKQDKMRIKFFFFFLGGGLLFPSYLQHKNKQFTFARRCLQREEGMRHDLFLRTASIQLAKDQWTVCFCVVHSLEKEDFLKNVCILSCFVQLKSILSNLLCVSYLFFRTLAVNSVSGFNIAFSKICTNVANHIEKMCTAIACALDKTMRQLA